MKLLVMTDYISKDVKGGAYEFLYRVCQNTSKICDISIVCFKPSDSNAADYEEEGRLKIYRVKRGAGKRNILRTIEHDAVFINSTKTFAMYYLTMGLKRRPVIYMIHGTAYLERLYNKKGRKDLKYFALKIFEAWQLAASDGLLFHSKYMLHNSIKKYRHIKKAAIVPPPVCEPRLSRINGDELKIQRRIESDIKAGYRIMFCIRRLVPRTGVLLLPDMMKSLEDKRLKLYIAGAGVLAGELKKRIEELNLSEAVVHLGHISDELRNRIYSLSFLSVIPTQALEGFSVSMLESMSFGCPPVVTPVGGMYEFIKDNDLLELAAPGLSYEDIAFSVNKLMADVSLRNALKTKCMEISKRYCRPESSKQFLTEIAYLLEKAGKAESALYKPE